MHGRKDILNNAEAIQEITQQYCANHPCPEDATLIAAAIAHQASDPTDRPFSWDVVDVFTEFAHEQGWKERPPSVGIAQLTREEFANLRKTGHLDICKSDDLYDPEVAIYGMSAKLWAAYDRIKEYEKEFRELSLTDRAMLFALAQNEGAGVVNTFFSSEVDMDWDKMLREVPERDKRETYTRNLRYVALHIDWLVGKGWSWPPDIDMNYWRVTAFTDVPGVDY